VNLADPLDQQLICQFPSSIVFCLDPFK